MSSSLFSSSSTKGTMVFDGAPQPQLASASSSSKSAKKDKASKRDVAPARPSSSSAGASSEKPKKRRAEAEAPADASPPGAPPDEPPKKKDKKKETDLPESSAAAAASAAAAEKPTRKQRAETDRAEQNARTIFVGNLPIDADADRISKHFARHGSVLTVRIRSAAPSDPKMPKKAAVITGQLDRGIRDSYNAYVVFKEARSVVAAVETNGQLFEGRHLRVDRVAGAGAGSSAPSAGENKRSVFLGNLPFNVQEEEVRQLFARCGAVENVRLVRRRRPAAPPPPLPCSPPP